MNRVGLKIKEERLKKGFSEKALGKKLGVSESFIKEVEQGRRVVNEKIIDRISKVLGSNINDLILQEPEDVKEVKREKRNYEPSSSRVNTSKGEKGNEIWTNAFNSVLKNIPIFNYDMNKVLENRMLPILSNKIEGHTPDKVFFIEVENNEMSSFRIVKGDKLFLYSAGEVNKEGIYFIEYGNKRAIRQIKRMDSSKLLLISNNGNLKTETVNHKEVKIIGKVIRGEISF